jgi:hypothetical protein
MRRLLVIFCWAVVTPSFAQYGVMPIELFSDIQMQNNLKDSARQVHPEIKPYSAWSLQRYSSTPDSVSSFIDQAFQQRDEVVLKVVPIVGAGMFLERGNDQRSGLNSLAGLGVRFHLRNRLYLNADWSISYADFPSYYRTISDSLMVFPGMRIRNVHSKYIGLSSDQLTVNLAYKPSEHFELFAGRGKHFIGEGYRSVFLSDFASNYNYFRADASVWKLKYMMLYTQMRQTSDYPSAVKPLSNKYSSVHYLSVNLTKWWSIGAFECVVWESEDSAQRREIDINYLNPVIFFRPVEYGLGSSDNYLLGFSSTVRPATGWSIYAQVLLDEFLFGEVTAPLRRSISGDSTIRSGYWANKQAYQLGVKVLEPFNWANSSALAEVNIVRPFTYGHSNPRQSYTHLNQPLAHPLGANFVEWVQVLTWQPQRWRFALVSSFARKGYSTQQYFMGEDLLISNVERNQNEREYGNWLLQGRRVDVAQVRLIAGYTLIEAWNLRAEAIVHYRLERRPIQKNEMVYFGLGLKTALWNQDFNL